jgi:hypothetical protein
LATIAGEFLPAPRSTSPKTAWMVNIYPETGVHPGDGGSKVGGHQVVRTLVASLSVCLRGSCTISEVATKATKQEDDEEEDG